MKIRAEFEKNTYLNDVQEIPRAFVPYIEIDENADYYLKWHHQILEDNFYFHVESNIWGNENFSLKCDEKDDLIFKRKTKYFAKKSLYRFLSENLKISLPYGSLTGIRPTRMYFELSQNLENPKKELVENFYVSEEKADLIEDCSLYQQKFLNRDLRNVGLYVNIPFCPTRCAYCSFISTEITRVYKEIPRYIECVKKDILTNFGIIDKRGFNVRSIYFGGGTPTSLGAKYLEELLVFFKDFGVEFCVECGRPDTINEEIVSVLLNNSVTRVSINPQTFHDRTLDLIGRKHSVEDFYRAYNLLKDRGMDVNFDLIASLPGEDFSDFKFSIDSAISLSPDNITVHTLSIKRGSDLNKSGESKKAEGVAIKMTDYAYSTLKSAGFYPYYMYRQKNTADNLENVGYCKDGKICLYNVDTMEEGCSVLASGAGAVAKNMMSQGKIERFSHPKGFREYCDRVDETDVKMKEFFGVF